MSRIGRESAIPEIPRLSCLLFVLLLHPHNAAVFEHVGIKLPLVDALESEESA